MKLRFSVKVDGDSCSPSRVPVLVSVIMLAPYSALSKPSMLSITLLFRKRGSEGFSVDPSGPDSIWFKLAPGFWWNFWLLYDLLVPGWSDESGKGNIQRDVINNY